MSLDTESFFKAFADDEVREVVVESMPEGHDNRLCIKSLSYADYSRFKEIAVMIRQRSALALMGKAQDSDAQEKQLERAEDYLLRKSMCSPSGDLLFNDDSVFSKWRSVASRLVGSEILEHISDLNDFNNKKSLEEEQEKK